MQHLDNLTIERFVAEDVPPALRASVEEHLAVCERCTRVVTLTRAFVQEELLAHPSADFMASLPRGAAVIAGPWRSPARWVPLLVAASVCAILLNVRMRSAAEAPETRFKGGTVSVHLYRGDASTVLSHGGHLRVGDRVEVRALNEPHAQFVFISDAGQPIPLRPAAHGNEVSAWFVMDDPCTSGWIVVQGAAQPDTRLRLECEN